ncbi:hypothetical protein GF343_01200 [Candidatus Woesearchaeota archaeon]|nr:hypothetical protein [Candidatus Woesearchaeota archaeon]
MRDLKELYQLVDHRLDGRPADKFTLEQLVPKMEELEGFTDTQIIFVVTDRNLRVPYCTWCEDRIKPNGKWINIPDSYKALILTGKYLPKNQTACDKCGEDMSPGYTDFLEQNKAAMDDLSANGEYCSDDFEL